MTRRALFIVNPTSGGGRGAASWARLKSWLEIRGWKSECVLTDGPGEALRIAKDAAPRFELLVAVGGDGTVSEVADGVLKAPPPGPALGVVPCGTGNDWAATLGIVTEEAAQKALEACRNRRVDVIEVHCCNNGRPYVRHALLFAATGVAIESLKKTTPTIKRIFGQRFAYPVGLLRALWDYRSEPMRVVLNNQVWEESFLFAGASNSERAGGGLKLAPGALIDDGRLNVNLVEALGRWQAFGQVRRLSQGRHTAHPKVHYCTAQSLEVATKTPMEIAADGELIGFTPARFTVRPGALAVLGPNEHCAG